MKKLIFFMLLFVAAVSTTQAAAPLKKKPFAEYSNEVIIQWNTTAFEVMQGPAYNALMATRTLSMVHIAIHDALNSIQPVYETYSLKQQDSKADPIAAASAAAHTVLVGLHPDKKAKLDSALADALKNVKVGAAKDRGLALGTEAGKSILIRRGDDGAFADPIAQGTNPKEPGLYQPTPPMPIVFAPFWATLPTFGLNFPSQFRVKPMPSIASAEYTKAYNEVKAKGSKENSTRTETETYIAKFWYEFSEIGWNRVTTIAVRDANLDLLGTARLYALVNIAMADSYIAGWDSKFHYNFWRPYTAIRVADTDGNDNTQQDAAWEPLMGTPPIHDYPSTHSVLGNAAATVLAATLGNKGFTMTSTSAEPAGTTRSFTSFTQAAVENADSRVLAGLHFRFSCDSGIKLGADIGEWVVNHQLKPRTRL